jgi:hypothetical protein
VQDEQPHAVEDRLVHARDDGVVDLLVSDVPPPRQHVGVVEHVLRQPVLGLLLRRRADTHAVAEQLGQARGDRAVQPVWIERANLGLVALVDVLPPYGHPHDLTHLITTSRRPTALENVGRPYAVRVGHHRVSVARARGAVTIDAIVA